MPTSNFINLKARVLNQPLLLEPSYAQVLFGALADRLGIDQLVNEAKTMDAQQLKEGAFAFDNERGERKPYAVNARSAMIDVSGSLVAKSSYLSSFSGITGYDKIKADLDVAFADADVDTITLMMDSSGGEVVGCFELADYIYKNRDTKHMTALVGGLACSACYALAAATNKIVMSETSTVGSIGVITAHTSVEKAMADKGVKVTLIHAGKHKADGNPYVDLPDEVKDRIQGRLDKIYGMFAERLAKYRAISVDAVKATEALTYLGTSAMDVGLADEVVSGIDFIERMSQTSGTNINLENNMPKENLDHEQALAHANAAGHKIGHDEGFKAGGEAMQTRIEGILAHANAEGKTTMASHLAFKTQMNVEEAGAMLAVAASEIAPVATVEAVASTGFNEAMESGKADEVGAESTEITQITAESDPVAFAMASAKAING